MHIHAHSRRDKFDAVLTPHLLRLAGRSLWSTAAAGRPPGPNMPPSVFPKSSLREAEGEVPRPKILGEEPAAGGVLEQS